MTSVLITGSNRGIGLEFARQSEQCLGPAERKKSIEVVPH